MTHQVNQIEVERILNACERTEELIVDKIVAQTESPYGHLSLPEVLKRVGNCVEGRQSMSERRTRIALLEANLKFVNDQIEGIESDGEFNTRDEQIAVLNLEKLTYLEQLNAAYREELAEIRK